MNFQRAARHSFFHHNWKAGFIAFLLSVVGIVNTAAQTSEVTKEYQIKAAYLFHFVQFVTWPDAAFTNAEAPICIGVLGDDPFGNALEEIIRDETVQRRRLTLFRSKNPDELKHCHMVFVSQSERERVSDILAELGSRSVLTVGEVDGFTQHGGIIHLYLAKNKVRFEINSHAAQVKGLKVSSEVLALGTITGAKPVEPKH